MIITCPHCQTRYQVAFEAIGSAGRKVQCAHCSKAWEQRAVAPQAPEPEDDKLFDSIVEAAMDAAMVEEERSVSGGIVEKLKQVAAEQQVDKPAGVVDPAVIRKRQRAFSRRQDAMAAQLPLARFRRVARIAGVVALVGIVAGAYFGRSQIVEQFPAAAGLYAAVGLGVNIVGLDFARLDTLRTLRDGKEVLVVSADVVGRETSPVMVPPVVVTLVNAAGDGIYEWSITPQVRDLMVGETASIETQLTQPPSDAVGVRLSFTGGGAAQSAAPRQVAAATPAVANSGEEHH